MVTPASISQVNSVQQAASAIVALINVSPRSPRQEEIEAIVAKVVTSGTAPATPLLAKIRETATRLDKAFDVQGKLTPGHPAEEAAQARIDQLQGDLEHVESQLPNPPQSFADLLAWAEIARAGADIRKEGTLGETSERDVFLRPAARLVDAVLQYPGVQPAPLAMSPAHAAHYREWRRLIEGHVRRFSNPNEEDMTKAETEAEEERMAASMEVINGVADEILAEPVQTRRDLPPCAEVAFWYQWSGIDPQGPDAIGQMEAGPMRGGKAIAPSGRPLHWRPSRLDGT